MSLTLAQQRAVAARGNVLVMAGAGTGKTSTLVARCIDCLRGSDPASLDELLVVTFTEAAAAEARERIRAALDLKFSETGDEHWAQQLALFDAAHIGTLHGFCFKLVRQHFYQLGLDPQVAVLDQGQAKLLSEETLTALLDEHYAGKLPGSAAVQQLIESHGSGRDEAIRRLVQKLHAYGQTRADSADWFARQTKMFSADDPQAWHEWLLEGIADWRRLWQPELERMKDDNVKARECAKILATLPASFTREQAAVVVEKVVAAADGPWPPRKKGVLEEPLKDLFAEAEFLHTLAPPATSAERRSPNRREPEPKVPKHAESELGAPMAGADPLVEDWQWSRKSMLALLRLTKEFTARFRDRKRDNGVVDFHDLEQLALELLWDTASGQPSPIAIHWREKIRFVFVDEYQDINAAQDRIIAALSRDDAQANRFLVGDVKQSIYRFRLAEPGIFRGYARDWTGPAGTTISLAENFRSRPALLAFVNAVFAPLMREEIGGLVYDHAARLIPGGGPPAPAASAPEVELLFRLSKKNSAPETGDDPLEDLRGAEKEARHLALRLRELKESGFQILDRETRQPRAVAWRDMAVLLRAPTTKAEGYARQFELAGVPLDVAHGGFYESLEVADLLNLLRLLDNPLQDVPLLAVLRSPLVALSLDELAAIRLAAKGHFWTALVRWAEVQSPEFEGQSLESKVAQFLTRFARWRALARQASLSTCLDEILASMHYAEWLREQERGAQRHANVQRLLGLAEQFDQFQRQGLFRFLRFIEAQQAAGAEPDVAETAGANAVRLMSVHQSKGLEFPVVAVADLGKHFNVQDLRAEIILDEKYGLCPQVKPPQTGARYPSPAHWLAQQRQKRELLGEELRLLYVAMTRARDQLILTGSLSRKRWDELPATRPAISPRAVLSAKSSTDWLRLWLAHHSADAGIFFSWRELDDAALHEKRGEAQADAESGSSAPPLDDTTLAELRAKLAWKYPFTPATERAAKTSVTALRRQAAEEMEDEAEKFFRLPPTRAARIRPAGKLSPAEIGTAHHKFLERVALEQTDNTAALQAEAKLLAGERWLTDEEVAALDFAALEKFWQSDVGQKIRAHAAHVRRELPFTARFAPAELDALIRGSNETERRLPERPDDEFVVVQGVADLIVLQPDEIWLLDFKTDELRADELAAKTDFYAPQLQLYARALARIFARPVTHAWLHFLATGITERVSVAAGAPVSNPARS
jgi:ATP-dependent helicase/nuclease subunit A